MSIGRFWKKIFRTEISFEIKKRGKFGGFFVKHLYRGSKRKKFIFLEILSKL